jgi:CelD/BcsL family acetyltransferase involved in cellulose biosynthesis
VAQGRAVSGVQHYSRLDDIAEAWDELLARSNADPLFNSREWLTTWWDQYGSVLGAQLDIRVFEGNSGLTGLALMQRRIVRHLPGLKGLRLELLGTARGASGVGFSERTDIIADAFSEPDLIDRFAAELVADKSWSDLFVSYTPEGGVTHRAMAAAARLCSGDLRVVDGMEAWEVSLRDGFDAFLESLGSGTRARLMNGRKRLANAGVLCERVLGVDELDRGWDIFTELHMERWNRPLSDHWRGFYGAVARSQAQRGIPVMSVLELDGRPLSVLVNFRAGRREYAIASAFRTVDLKRISPGWVHFGMVIERACADGIQSFDFLGGEGKNEQYKAAFAGESSQLHCLQLVRSRRLKWCHRVLDAMRMVRDRLQGRSG